MDSFELQEFSLFFWLELADASNAWRFWSAIWVLIITRGNHRRFARDLEGGLAMHQNKASNVVFVAFCHGAFPFRGR
jgi:hypothetical protein